MTSCRNNYLALIKALRLRDRDVLTGYGRSNRLWKDVNLSSVLFGKATNELKADFQEKHIVKTENCTRKK